MKDILEYPERYAITEDGRVYSKLRDKFISHHIINGYPAISTKVHGKSFCRYVHRLLAQAYIPNPYNLPLVNHKDGNKLNYSLPNLEWCSYQENTDHTISTGLLVPSRKLSDQHILEIYSSRDSYVVLADRHNVGKSTIEAIKKGERYAHMFSVDLVHKNEHSSAKLTPEDVHFIRNSTDSVANLSIKFGVSKSSVRKVLNRVSYSYLP